LRRLDPFAPGAPDAGGDRCVFEVVPGEAAAWVSTDILRAPRQP